MYTVRDEWNLGVLIRGGEMTAPLRILEHPDLRTVWRRGNTMRDVIHLRKSVIYALHRRVVMEGMTFEQACKDLWVKAADFASTVQPGQKYQPPKDLTAENQHLALAQTQPLKCLSWIGKEYLKNEEGPRGYEARYEADLTTLYLTPFAWT